MREDVVEQYLAFKLIDSDQDWNSKWFYITNHHPELRKLSGKQPKHQPWWNSEPMMQEGIQLPELLAKIKALREAEMDDTSQRPRGEVDDDDIVDRLGRIFKEMPAYTTCPVHDYSAVRPPNEVSSRTRVEY
jgi:hypothetical protein